jgi:molybdate transport system substrate-binding protein
MPSAPRRRRRLAAVALASVVLAALGCSERRDELVVLAAASLAEAFHELGLAYELAHPGERLVFSFAGSQTIAAQLRAGASAHLIATAHPDVMARLQEEKRVLDVDEFATNRLVWVFAGADPPASAAELARRLPHSDWRLVLAAPEVPAGRYALAALERMGLREPAEARLVSRELDVKGVLAKLQLGGADAGLVYATDVAPTPGVGLTAFELPDAAQVQAHYRIATVANERRARAQAFIGFVQGDEGQAILRAHGFGAAS